MSDSDNPMIEWLRAWCDERRLKLVLDGEVGFGRECVGIQEPASQHYVDVDYEQPWDAEPVEGENYWPALDPDPVMTPNAYHKHPCLCVLRFGDPAESMPAAVGELYEWVRKLDALGVKVETIDRVYEGGNDNVVNRAMHGPTRTRLVPA